MPINPVSFRALTPEEVNSPLAALMHSQDFIKALTANQRARAQLPFAGPQAEANLRQTQLGNLSSQAQLPWAGWKSYADAQSSLSRALLDQAAAKMYGAKPGSPLIQNGHVVGNTGYGLFDSLNGMPSPQQGMPYPGQQNMPMPVQQNMPNPNQSAPYPGQQQVPSKMSRGDNGTNDIGGNTPLPMGIKNYDQRIGNKIDQLEDTEQTSTGEKEAKNKFLEDNLTPENVKQQALYSIADNNAIDEAQEASNKVQFLNTQFSVLEKGYQGQKTLPGNISYKAKELKAYLSGKGLPDEVQAQIAANQMLPQVYDTMRSIFTKSTNQGQAIAFSKALVPKTGETTKNFTDRLDAMKFWMQNYAAAQQKVISNGIPNNAAAQIERENQIFISMMPKLSEVYEKSPQTFKLIWNTLPKSQKEYFKKYNKSLGEE